MVFISTSKPGSWTLRLYEILRPAPHPLAVQFSNSQSRFRHKAGEIWRHALTTSVYHDLAGENNLLTDKAPLRSHTWRRFIRVECLGLSGLLFYEIRLLPPVGSRTTGVCDDGLSVESVFGDLDDHSDEGGMDIDDLLDVLHAKVVYFPAYACTSFVIGQVMTAFFRGQPSLRPRPCLDGFSVPVQESPKPGLEVSSDIVKSMAEVPIVRVLDTASDGELSPSYSWQVICDDLAVFDKLSLDSDDPHRPLCVRASHVSPHDIGFPGSDYTSDVDDDDKDDGNTTASTIASIVPSTPPRCDVLEVRGPHDDSGRVTSSDSIFVQDSMSDCAIHSIVSTSKITRDVSEHPPGFVSGGTTYLSVHDDLSSFLDISY